MKICPICQSICSDDLDLCPDDGSSLVPYDLRQELRARRAHTSASQIDSLLFLLPEEWLPIRLRREVSLAAAELRRNPRLFLRGILQTDLDPDYRRSLELTTAIVITVVSTCFSIVLLVVGLLRPVSAGTEPGSRKEESDRGRDLVLVSMVRIAPPAGRPSTRRNGAAGGSLTATQRARGGGGGGQQMLERVEDRETAIAALQPPVIPPSPVPPKIDHPMLVVPEMVFVDPRSLPPVRSAVGDPSGSEGTRSGGSGQDGGMGHGRLGGIGPNDGPGFGPGRLMGTGGGAFQPGGGPTRGNGSDDEIPWATSRLRPTIVYKEKARYTEQARQIRFREPWSCEQPSAPTGESRTFGSSADCPMA